VAPPVEETSGVDAGLEGQSTSSGGLAAPEDATPEKPSEDPAGEALAPTSQLTDPLESPHAGGGGSTGTGSGSASSAAGSASGSGSASGTTP